MALDFEPLVNLNLRSWMNASPWECMQTPNKKPEEGSAGTRPFCFPNARGLAEAAW